MYGKPRLQVLEASLSFRFNPAEALVDGVLQTDQNKDGGGYCYVSSQKINQLKPEVKLGMEGTHQVDKVRILMRDSSAVEHRVGFVVMT